MSYYEIGDVPKKQSYTFFEKQIRDLATASHELAKQTRDPRKKRYYLERARDYKISDPYTFITTLRAQYPNMP